MESDFSPHSSRPPVVKILVSVSVGASARWFSVFRSFAVSSFAGVSSIASAKEKATADRARRRLTGSSSRRSRRSRRYRFSSSHLFERASHLRVSRIEQLRLDELGLCLMSSWTREKLLTNIREVSVWKQGDQRAPHKPLLILYALGKLLAGQNDVRFKEFYEPFTKLLQEFGPPRKSYHPEFPFWYLRSEGFWEIEPATGWIMKKGGSSPSKSDLNKPRRGGPVCPNSSTPPTSRFCSPGRGGEPGAQQSFSRLHSRGYPSSDSS
jgi:hypothetical protein